MRGAFLASGRFRTLVALTVIAATMFVGSAAATADDDVSPPTLVDFAITPDVVDTSGSDQVITFTAHVTDDLAGLQWGLIFWEGPVAGQVVATEFFDPVNNLISGDELDGTYEFTMTLPQYSEPGTWSINSFQLRDNANNFVSLTAADVAALGLPSTFEQTGPGDAAAPALVDLTITPDVVDTSGSDQVITFTAHVTDDLAGLQRGLIFWEGPVAGQVVATESFDPVNNLISGDELDGTYEFTMTLPQYSEPGTWSINSFQLRDNANSFVSLLAADVAALGLPTTFEQTGAGDVAPPVLADFTISPTSVNTSASDQEITFTAHVTDDLAGLQFGTVIFESPTAGQIMFAEGFSPTFNIVSGDGFDGMYEFTGTLPQFSEQGIWEINSFQLEDEANNFVSLTAADVTALGLPTTFEVKEEVSEDAGAGDTVTTDPEGDGATSLDPVETSVTTPNAGTVTIEETIITQPAPAQVEFFGQQVNITAPAATAADPLIIVFTIDSSRVPAGEDETTVDVYKDGVLVAECAGAPMADPDPCVTDRVALADGDISFTLLTSTASAWNFGTGTAAENQPPQLDPIDPIVVTEGDTVDVAVSASDPDGDAIALSATGLPGFASLVDNGDGSGVLTVAPLAGDAGSYDATITASDGALTDEQLVSITVDEAPSDDVHVADLSLSLRRRSAVVAVTVVDAAGNSVSGAVVSGTFTVDDVEVATVTSRTTRGGATRVVARLGRVSPGATVEFCVTDIAHPTLTYDPGANVETCVSM